MQHNWKYKYMHWSGDRCLYNLYHNNKFNSLSKYCIQLEFCIQTTNCTYAIMKGIYKFLKIVYVHYFLCQNEKIFLSHTKMTTIELAQ